MYPLNYFLIERETKSSYYKYEDSNYYCSSLGYGYYAYYEMNLYIFSKRIWNSNLLNQAIMIFIYANRRKKGGKKKKKREKWWEINFTFMIGTKSFYLHTKSNRNKSPVTAFKPHCFISVALPHLTRKWLLWAVC